MTDVSGSSLENPNRETHCPYCGVDLGTAPQRKKKCPACKQFMYVKTLPASRERVLVTEERAEAIEAEWSSIMTRKRWIELLAAYGITAEDYDREKQSAKTEVEVVNRLLEKALQLNRGKWHFLSTIYYDMAVFAQEQGDQFKIYLAKAAQMRLEYYRAKGRRKVQIHTAKDEACQACQALQDKVYSIDEALKKMPIPCEECATWEVGFCRCSYMAVI